MTDVFVLPFTGPAEEMFEGENTLEVLAELPVLVLQRVVRGYGRLVYCRGQVVIRPDDEESAEWITKTLLYLGIPVAWWGHGTGPRGTENPEPCSP